VTAGEYDQLLERIDSALAHRVVVYGSVPPNARDLDLLARPDDVAAIARTLREDGFGRSKRTFVAFRGCSVLVVELIPAARLGLPAGELNVLYDEAVPFGGLTNVTEPSPHHSVLILARRLDTELVLQAKHRARIDRAVASDAHVWQRAQEHATGWSAERALERLRSLYDGHDVGSPRRHRLRRPRRTRVLALIGHDADRTRSHAESLREALDRIGFDARVVAPVPVPRSRVGTVGAALARWRQVWRHLGRGTVLICHQSPQSTPSSDPVLRLLSPRPLRSYVIDPRRSRQEACEQLAEDAWRSLGHRSRLNVRVRGILTAVRRRSARLRDR
jgi:hypothetical protein